MENSAQKQILTSVESQIAEMTEKIIAKDLSRGIKHSDYSKEIISFGLKFDLIKAMSKYLNNDDKLVNVKSYWGANGIEIYSLIERNGLEYRFITEAIEAGGWNIQEYHFRYIVKTDLPKDGSDSLLNEYKEIKKKMTKIEKLTNDISMINKRLESERKKYNELMAMSNEELSKWYLARGNNDYWTKFTYDPTNPNFTSEQHYNEWIEEIRREHFERAKREVSWIKKYILTDEIQLEKLEKKLRGFN